MHMSFRSINYLLITKLFFLSIVISGCSVQDKLSTEPDLPESVIIVPSTETSKPVMSLIAKARDASRNGDIPQARADIERAIRIEPRNATLWHYLGKLSLQQTKYREAINYALKSNQLTSDKKLKSDNWRILAHAKYQLGDLKGAQAAQLMSRKIIGGD